MKVAGEGAAYVDIITLQLQVMWDVIIASRFDLLMLTMGLAAYVLLFQSRNRWRKAGAQKHVQQKAKELDMSPSPIVNHDQQKYERLLAMHIANNAQAEFESLLGRMQTEQITLREETINSLLVRCSRLEYTFVATLEAFVKAQGPCSDTTYNLRIKAAAPSRPQARAIMEEILDRPGGSAFSFELVLSFLGFCRMSASDRPMVDRLLQRIQTLDMDILSEFIQFYLDTNQPEKACDVFELNFAAFFENELGQDTEWTLMNAAMKCGRLSLGSHLFETSHVDATKSVLKIQKWWKRSPHSVHTASRQRAVSDVFGRLALVFNERFPFEEDSNVDSNDESTVFLGDIDDRHDSDFDSDYDGNNWSVDY